MRNRDKYVRTIDALNCFEDICSYYGDVVKAEDNPAYKRIDELPEADVIPVEWIESQVDKGKWNELVRRWREYELLRANIDRSIDLGRENDGGL